MLDYAQRVLRSSPPDADFHPAVRRLLADSHVTAPMDHFMHVAHQRLPAAGQDAPAWRMVYIDAAVLKALARAESQPDLHEEAARECIATLDRAIIVAGAATDETRRDHVVHDLIRHLQSAIPWLAPSSTVFTPPPTPVSPLCTSRNTPPTLAVLPSILAPQEHWSRAPFVIRRYADHWPAMHHPHQWASASYLFSVAGPGRIVPVEVGDDYRSDDWAQKLISWEDFLAFLDPSSPHRPHQTFYLAQHSLFSQFPRLLEDIVFPDIVYASLDSPDFPAYEPPPNVIVNAWLGPKGTISPAHTDPFFNCYVQVVGRKTVWLAPNHVAAAMYPCAGHNPAASSLMSNTSQVDVFAATPAETEASRSAFPLFWDMVPGEACCATLNPGDLLFFPPGWWHAMRSEDVSFSVSMWF